MFKDRRFVGTTLNSKWNHRAYFFIFFQCHFNANVSFILLFLFVPTGADVLEAKNFATVWWSWGKRANGISWQNPRQSPFKLPDIIKIDMQQILAWCSREDLRLGGWQIQEAIERWQLTVWSSNQEICKWQVAVKNKSPDCPAQVTDRMDILSRHLSQFLSNEGNRQAGGAFQAVCPLLQVIITSAQQRIQCWHRYAGMVGSKELTRVDSKEFHTGRVFQPVAVDSSAVGWAHTATGAATQSSATSPSAALVWSNDM